MAESAKAPDPKALEVKYTYPDAATDDATIKRVEKAIAGSNMLGYATGLAQKADDAPVSKEEYEEQTKEAREKERQERLLHPDDVKKEEQESPPDKPGAPVKPTLQSVSPPKGGAQEAQKGGKGEGAKPHGKGDKPHGPPGAAPSVKPPRELALAAASSSDGDLDKWLNNYPHKSTETTERLSKIKEMSGVAKSFDGQVEGYVAEGSGKMASAKAGLIGFLGKKELGAIFGHNPYESVQGGLGSFMRFLSVFQNVVSIVGNICTKVGMVLTVLGLIGMILGPIGAAVSAVARVLNVVGIVCDAIGFAVSGVLAGLNGVVLAKQIGSGASNEEKAATADMMMTEATSAGGHVLSLAMSYGPGFMKGFKNASKGIIGRLFSGIRDKIGKFATKALGPVGNWAKKIGYKMGFGLAEKTGESMASKLWNAPGSIIKRARKVGFIERFNNSDFAKSVEQKAAKFENMGWVNKVEGLGEKAGAGLGSWNEAAAGKTVSFRGRTFQANQFATDAEDEFHAAAGEIAGKNAGDKARAKIDREISTSRETANNQIADHRNEDGFVPKENRDIAKASRRHADNLERSEEKVVANKETEATVEGTKAHHDARIEKVEEGQEEDKLKAEWRNDPKKFQEDTELKRVEADAAETRAKLPNITDDERKTAERVAEELKEEVNERQMLPFKAGGMEAPETAWGAFNYGKEWWAALHGKDEKGEKAEEATKHVEGYAGGHAETEKREKAEQRENIEEWSKAEAPEVAVYEHVEGMLEGLDDGEEHEGDEHEGGEHEHEEGQPDHEDGDEVKADEPDAGGPASLDTSSEPAAASASTTDAPQPSNDNGPAAPTGNDAGPADVPGAGAGSESPRPAPRPAPSDEDKADVPELVYWPKLVVGSDADFAKGAKDLMRMKQIAYAFQKAQLEARKKALEAVAAYAASNNDGNLRQAHAMDHSITINGSVEEASKSSAAANDSSQHAGAGAAQQEKGKGNSNAPAGETNIDIGEKPSRWHPIKRIWWYVKNWAKKTAARVFGWIQDQIASLVLRLLCGVSMEDMRAYTAALHRRMDFSKGVGQQGIATSQAVKAKAAKQTSDSGQYSDEALDDAKECDKNVHDADKFVQDIEATEQDLQKQQAAAKQFLSDLNTAVAAERARKAEEKQKEAAEAAKVQQGATGAPAPASGATPPSPAPPPPAAKTAAAPVKKPAKPASKKKSTEPNEKKISAASVSKVQNAASYVTSQTSVVINQLTKSKEEQFGKLWSKFENKKTAGPIVAKVNPGERVLRKATETVRQVNADMAEINSMSPANANVLHAQAGKVRSGAKELDSLAKEAQEQLNYSFKLTYDKINQTAELSAYF